MKYEYTVHGRINQTLNKVYDPHLPKNVNSDLHGEASANGQNESTLKHIADKCVTASFEIWNCGLINLSICCIIDYEQLCTVIAITPLHV